MSMQRSPTLEANPLRDRPGIRELLAKSTGREQEPPEKIRARTMLNALFGSKPGIAGRTGESVGTAAKARFDLLRELRSKLHRLGESASYNGPVSWPFETWLRALELSRSTPQRFGELFAVVTSRAIESGDLETARDMVQGLATLRAGASLVAPSTGEYFLAHRSAGGARRAKPLETREGLLKAVSIGAEEAAHAVLFGQNTSWLALHKEAERVSSFSSPATRGLEQDLVAAMNRLEASRLPALLEEASSSSTLEALRALTEELKNAVKDLEVARSALAGTSRLSSNPSQSPRTT